MWEPVILFGGIIFWAVVAIFFAILTAFVENNSGRGATFTLIGALFLFGLFSDLDILGWISANPWTLLVYVASYFAVGVIWMTVKWWLYCLARAEEAEAIKDKYLADKSLQNGSIPDRKDFEKTVCLSSDYHDTTFPPKAVRHANDIIRWGCYWPFSLFWTVVGDILLRLWRFIYFQISHVLQAISNRMFKEI